MGVETSIIIPEKVKKIPIELLPFPNIFPEILGSATELNEEKENNTERTKPVIINTALQITPMRTIRMVFASKSKSLPIFSFDKLIILT